MFYKISAKYSTSQIPNSLEVKKKVWTSSARTTADCHPISHRVFLLSILQENILKKNCPLGRNGPFYTYSQTRTANYNWLTLLCNTQNKSVQTLSPNLTEVYALPKKSQNLISNIHTCTFTDSFVRTIGMVLLVQQNSFLAVPEKQKKVHQ